MEFSIYFFITSREFTSLLQSVTLQINKTPCASQENLFEAHKTLLPSSDALAPKKWMEIPVFGFFFLYIASQLRRRKVDSATDNSSPERCLFLRRKRREPFFVGAILWRVCGKSQEKQGFYLSSKRKLRGENESSTALTPTCQTVFSASSREKK